MPDALLAIVPRKAYGWESMKSLPHLLASLGLVCVLPSPQDLSDPLPARQHYSAFRATAPLQVDGRMEESDWKSAPWTNLFVDIEGEKKSAPRLATRAKMLWDADYFYIAAEMEEPHLWGTLTERDSVIFYDNDFEVFIDPDGDTHDYYELEVNALGTEWDLLLEKPYRDGGPALHEFDTPGLLSAVQMNGTLNDPSDIDRSWTIEIAIPFAALRAIAGRPTPPANGDVWWVNFSRVQWKLDVVDGSYTKRADDNGKQLREDNWVWSPQGVIAMHEPESWGLVQFVGSPAPEAGQELPEFELPADLWLRYVLHELYDAQRAFRDEHGVFFGAVEDAPAKLRELCKARGFELSIHRTPSMFEARLEHKTDGLLRINHEGHIW